MVTNLAIAIKRIFKVFRVHFLLQDKDVIDVLRKEGVKLKMLMHAHQAFYVVVPEGSKIEEFKVNFLFKNVADVLKM